MIAKLTGLIDSLGDGSAVVDVGGVGYLVSCSGRTLARLNLGEVASLHIDTHVRDDAIQLFGFAEAGERQWFRLLLSVQGVGPKAALAVLSAVPGDELLQAIAAGDRGVIGRAVGIGPKLASRIVGELKDKVAMPGASAGAGMAPTPSLAAGSGPAADAVSALVHLGFRPIEAFGAVQAAAARLGADAPLEALIRSGLADLAPKE